MGYCLLQQLKTQKFIISVVLARHCNLKCRYCNAFCNFAKKQFYDFLEKKCLCHPSFNELETNTSNYSSALAQLNTIGNDNVVISSELAQTLTSMGDGFKEYILQLVQK